MSPLGKDDHLILKFNYNVTVEKIDCMKTKFLFHKVDYASMKSELNKVNLREAFVDKNVEEQWDYFSEVHNFLLNKYLPKIRFNMLKMDKHDIPMPKEVVMLIKSKHTSWSKYMDTRKDIHYKIISSKTSNIEKIGKLYSDPLDTSIVELSMIIFRRPKSLTTTFLVRSLMNLYSTSRIAYRCKVLITS